MRTLNQIVPLLTERMKKHAARAWTQKALDHTTLAALQNLLDQIEELVDKNVDEEIQIKADEKHEKPEQQDKPERPEGSPKRGRPRKDAVASTSTSATVSASKSASADAEDELELEDDEEEVDTKEAPAARETRTISGSLPGIHRTGLPAVSGTLGQSRLSSLPSQLKRPATTR